MITAELHFDFGSPNAYLAHRVLPAIEARTGVKFKYVPILLGGVFKATGNQSPMQAFASFPSKLAYERLEMQRFIRRHGLTEFQRNPFFPVNTLHLMRGAVAADLEGQLPAYAEAAFHHMWEDPRKMDEPPIIEAALTESGLDGAHWLARMQDTAVKATLIANTEQSVARGCFGAPTFFIDGDIHFGKDRLPDVEAAMRGDK